jgi:phosphohistidine phosphatase SixA
LEVRVFSTAPSLYSGAPGRLRPGDAFRRFCLLLALLCAAGGAAADEAAALAALRAGGHVALMRHAEAPGTADPPGFKIDDCATQRNLDDKGRADAASAGARLRRDGARIEKIVSSPWCRCRETASLMKLGPVELVETLGNPVVLRDRRQALVDGTRALVDAWRGEGALLVVTHGATIQALTGMHPASGEIFVVKPRSGASVLPVIGRLPVER